MKPKYQSQHKLPQVYLRQFGYCKNGHWKVSVIKTDEKFTRQKSIESFSAEVNHFDINSDDERIHRLFEELNCDLETHYPRLISDLDQNRELSLPGKEILIQLIPNLMARSDYWRDWVKGLLDHPNKINFLKVLCVHYVKDYDEFTKIEEKDFFQILIERPHDEIINRVMLFFTGHLLRLLGDFEVVILKSNDGKPWFTTDNPVVLHGVSEKNTLITKDSELYFPISPNYLAYLHHKDSTETENIFRSYKSNLVHEITEEENKNLQMVIMENVNEYVIIQGEFKYKMQPK